VLDSGGTGRRNDEADAASDRADLASAVPRTAEFFGFGVPSLIRPTLGNLIADSTSSGIGIYNSLGLGWWVWAGPAITLVLILVCVNLVGDGLDRALNPRSN
jgi:ABC-type dipeptide/oligopeptide/nickel transport system permease subunit